MTYNVVKDYDWTSAPRGSGIRAKAPRVWVKSYKLKTNQIMQMINGYLNVAKNLGGDAKSFYEGMYSKSTTPEDDFNFPFFNDSMRAFGNTFGDTFQDGFGGGGGIGTALNDIFKTATSLGVQIVGAAGMDSVTKAGKELSDKGVAGITSATQTIMQGVKSGGDPGSYVETPMFYQFEKNDSPLQVSFVLSNTINSDYEKNHALVTKLTKINRPLRKNSIAVDPPRIYQVKVPGQRFIKWAYCSQFDVSLLGTRRMIGEVLVPEGYQISMTFQSLTLEHAGFMDEV